MTKRKIVTGVVVTLERLNNSFCGNPRWSVVIRNDEGTFTAKTANDAAVGYVIEKYRGETATFECHTTRNGNMVIDYDKTNR